MSTESNLPKCVAKRVSGKGTTIFQLSALANVLKEHYSTNTKAEFFTAGGIFRGVIASFATKETFITNNPDEPNQSIIDISYINEMKYEALRHQEDIDDEFELIDNSSMINLVEADFFPSSGNQPIHYKNVLLFSDQIIGFSLIPE